MDVIRTTDSNELPLVATAIIEAVMKLKPTGAHLVLLSGDLGAGKTAVTKAIAQLLGVDAVVSSPTFVIMRHYEPQHNYFTDMYHMDAYRIDSLEEVVPLHLEAIFSKSHSLFCIEWPERIAPLIPSPHLAVHATQISPGVHEYKLVPHV